MGIICGFFLLEHSQIFNFYLKLFNQGGKCTSAVLEAMLKIFRVFGISYYNK
jgi:hypothetical protein